VPRPRFAKLDPEKKDRILTAAAQEFAAHGFDGASLNQILERAEISKGAAYYYFDDKADLFATVVQHYWDETIGEVDFSLAELTAVNFWDRLEAVYRQQFQQQGDKPWMLGVVKAAGKMPPEMLLGGPLGDMIGQIMGWLLATLARGRELGVVRDDLAPDLMLALVAGIDNAADQWLIEHWPHLDTDEREKAVAQIFDVLRRALAPGREEKRNN
jgi:AcrR family transcriptional regulator